MFQCIIGYFKMLPYWQFYSHSLLKANTISKFSRICSKFEEENGHFAPLGRLCMQAYTFTIGAGCKLVLIRCKAHLLISPIDLLGPMSRVLYAKRVALRLGPTTEEQPRRNCVSSCGVALYKCSITIWSVIIAVCSHQWYRNVGLHTLWPTFNNVPRIYNLIKITSVAINY